MVEKTVDFVIRSLIRGGIPPEDDLDFAVHALQKGWLEGGRAGALVASLSMRYGDAAIQKYNDVEKKFERYGG